MQDNARILFFTRHAVIESNPFFIDIDNHTMKMLFLDDGEKQFFKFECVNRAGELIGDFGGAVFSPTKVQFLGLIFFILTCAQPRLSSKH